MLRRVLGERRRLEEGTASWQYGIGKLSDRSIVFAGRSESASRYFWVVEGWKTHIVLLSSAKTMMSYEAEDKAATAT